MRAPGQGTRRCVAIAAALLAGMLLLAVLALPLGGGLEAGNAVGSSAASQPEGSSGGDDTDAGQPDVSQPEATQPDAAWPDLGSSPEEGTADADGTDAGMNTGWSSDAPKVPADACDVSTTEVDGATVVRYRGGGDLAEQASQLLGQYEEGRDCLLRQAGYLDLLGNAWGCTVQGAGWVDVCVVTGREDGRSDVRIVRMDADDWRDVYGDS